MDRPHLYALTILLLTLLGCTQTAERDAKVGRQHRAYIDTTRTDWAGAAPRPLATTLWYPAPHSSVELEWRVGVFRFGQNTPNAPFKDSQRRPLVVLSHGTGGTAAQLSWLAERLVQAGYLVAAVNHHGNTAAEEKAWPHGFVLPAERARDLSALIDRLLADEEIAPHIDSNRIVAAGFSIGGYSVLAAAGAHLGFADRQRRCANGSGNPVCNLPPEAGFSEGDVRTLASSDAAFVAALLRDELQFSDPRIRAVYAIAPAFVSLMEKKDFPSPGIPIRVVLAEGDRQILLSQTLRSVEKHAALATVMTIPDAGHYAFLAPCTLRGRLLVRSLCKDPSSIDRAGLHNRVGSDAAAFFDASL